MKLPAVADGSQTPDSQGQYPLVQPHYQYGYDDFGQQTTLTDPLGHVTQFGYTDGRQTFRELPNGIRETFEYDDLGRQTLHVSFEGVVTASLYDPASGRLVQQRFFDNLATYENGAGTAAVTVTYATLFTETGREESVTRQSGSLTETWTSTYNRRGEFTSLATPAGTIHFEYDSFGHRTRTLAGSEATPLSDVRSTYDAFGRLASVTVFARDGIVLSAGEREVTTYSYDAWGNLLRQVEPNGIIILHEYDVRHRLTTLTHYQPDATPADLSDNPKVAEFAYTVDAEGQRTHTVETIWQASEPTQPEVTEFSWTYDDVGRLIEELADRPGTADDYRAQYRFDLTGNRTAKEVDLGHDASLDEVFTYHYDENDRLEWEELDRTTGNDETTLYTYTGTGTQQETKATYAGLQPSLGNQLSQTNFDYDVAGRVMTAVVSTFTDGELSRQETTHYRYDQDGIRFSALHEVDSDANGTLDERTLTEYLVDASNHTSYQQVLVETVSDLMAETVVRTVHYTLGHDVVSQTTVTYDNGQASEQTLVLGYDGHGSTRILTDTAAAIAALNALPQVFLYDAYGNLLNMTASQAGTSLLYSGEQFDQRIAMQYLRARYYDASNGRFVGLDPFSGNPTDPQSFHKYLYTHGDPINGIDPTGMFSTIQVMAVTGINTALAASLSAAYGAAKGWSPGRIAAFSAVSASIAFGVTLGFFGVASALMLGGYSAPVAITATALMFGPTSLGLAAANFYFAMQRGDAVDIAFATIDLALAAFGMYRAAAASKTLPIREEAFAAAVAERLAAIREGRKDGAAGVMMIAGDPFQESVTLPARSVNAGGKHATILPEVLDVIDGLRKTCVEPRAISSSLKKGHDPKGAWSAVVRLSDGKRLDACVACQKLLSQFGVRDANSPDLKPVLFLISSIFPDE